MLILGLATTPQGDAAAALFNNQALLAACHEAGHSRDIHFPVSAAQECLRLAQLRPDQVHTVAIGDMAMAIGTPAFWHLLKRQWQFSPLHAAAASLAQWREHRQQRNGWHWLLAQLGIDTHKTATFRVERTLALAHAGLIATGHPVDTCVLSCNDTLSPIAARFGKAHRGRFDPISTIAEPDSLLQVMRCMGAYLGFPAHQALEGIALLARHGDPDRYNLNRLFSMQNGRVHINLRLLTPDTRRGWQHEGKHYPFTQRLVDWLGPPAAEAPALDPHAHYAAALQRYFNDTLLTYFAHHLGEYLEASPAVLLGGDAALARHTSLTLLERSGIRTLTHSPFTGSMGAAIGAAAQVAAHHGILLDRIEHPFWGAGYYQEECIAACRRHPSRPAFDIIKDPARKAARLIAEGHVVGWLQGRAEASRLPLGTRAILQSPTALQRPPLVAIQCDHWSNGYTPVLSVSSTQASRYTHDSALTAFAASYVQLTPEAQQWLPADLQIGGTAPLQRVDKAFSPRFYGLLEEMEKISGHGMVLQLPMQEGDRRAISPSDALDWFAGSSTTHLVMEDVLVSKL